MVSMHKFAANLSEKSKPKDKEKEFEKDKLT